VANSRTKWSDLCSAAAPDSPTTSLGVEQREQMLPVAFPQQPMVKGWVNVMIKTKVDQVV